MKTIRSRVLKNGKTQVTVELGKDERLVTFSDTEHYKLSNGMGDGEVLPAHFLYDAEVVQWCPFEQKWV